MKLDELDKWTMGDGLYLVDADHKVLLRSDVRCPAPIGAVLMVSIKDRVQVGTETGTAIIYSSVVLAWKAPDSAPVKEDGSAAPAADWPMDDSLDARRQNVTGPTDVVISDGSDATSPSPVETPLLEYKGPLDKIDWQPMTESAGRVTNHAAARVTAELCKGEYIAALAPAAVANLGRCYTALLELRREPDE